MKNLSILNFEELWLHNFEILWLRRFKHSKKNFKLFFPSSKNLNSKIFSFLLKNFKTESNYVQRSENEKKDVNVGQLIHEKHNQLSKLFENFQDIFVGPQVIICIFLCGPLFIFFFLHTWNFCASTLREWEYTLYSVHLSGNLLFCHFTPVLVRWLTDVLLTEMGVRNFLNSVRLHYSLFCISSTVLRQSK